MASEPQIRQPNLEARAKNVLLLSHRDLVMRTKQGDIPIREGHHAWPHGLQCIAAYHKQATRLSIDDQMDMWKIIARGHYAIPRSAEDTSSSHKLYKNQIKKSSEELSWGHFVVLRTLYGTHLSAKYVDRIRKAFGTTYIEDFSEEYYKLDGAEPAEPVGAVQEEAATDMDALAIEESTSPNDTNAQGQPMKSLEQQEADLAAHLAALEAKQRVIQLEKEKREKRKAEQERRQRMRLQEELAQAQKETEELQHLKNDKLQQTPANDRLASAGKRTHSTTALGESNAAKRTRMTADEALFSETLSIARYRGASGEFHSKLTTNLQSKVSPTPNDSICCSLEAKVEAFREKVAKLEETAQKIISAQEASTKAIQKHAEYAQQWETKASGGN